MSPSIMPSKELLAAYNESHYDVYTPEGTITIRIGLEHPQIDALLSELKKSSWAFITAYNPFSIPLTDHENIKRNELLKTVVLEMGYTFFDGAGKGEDLSWPPELSILIPGIPLPAAMELGIQFEQNAIVYGDEGEKAQLILCVTD